MRFGKLAGYVASAFLASLANAGEMPKEGRMDFDHCMTGKFVDIVATPQLQAGYIHENYASTISNPPGGPFDQLGAHCAPIYLRRGSEMAVNGYCRYTDGDGDTWVMSFVDRIGPDHVEGSFELTVGTGKYEGAAIRGTFTPANGIPPAAQPGVFQRCTRVVGTYRLR